MVDMTPRKWMLAALRSSLMALEQMPESEVQESFTGGHHNTVVTVRYLATPTTGTERDK